MTIENNFENWRFEHNKTDLTLQIANASSMVEFLTRKGKLMEAKKWQVKVDDLEKRMEKLIEEHGGSNE